MSDRIPLDHLTSDALDALYAERDRLTAELAALRQVARGYCPECGRGDAAPTVADWEQQRQRADEAEERLRHLQTTSETAGILLTRTTDERDRLAGILREVLDAFEAYWARASYCGPGGTAVQPEHFQGWRAALEEPTPGPAGIVGICELPHQTIAEEEACEQRRLDAPAATQATGHVYLSTGCLHGDLVLPDGRTGHQYCQSDTGKAGAKKPSRCKWCDAFCQCACHAPTKES